MQLAAAVVAWLENQRFEVYQEVQLRFGCNVADIVATRDGLLWVVETKTTLTLEVIAQAKAWKPYAHRTFIAVPKARTFSAGRALAYDVCRSQGIGALEVSEPHTYDMDMGIRERVSAAINRRADAQAIRSLLTGEHKTFAKAGNADGKRWTPFKNTCKQVRDHVTANPGVTLKECVDAIDHHYASPTSARSSIAAWARAGILEGVHVAREGQALKLYPKAELTDRSAG